MNILMDSKPNISLFVPAYNDERTIRIVVENALNLLNEIANQFEIIIINDGSPDNSGQIAEMLAKEHEQIRVVHHPHNLGYAASFRTGVSASQYEWICMVDGDNEYDVYELRKMLSVRQYYLLIIAFRYRKLYSAKRILISYVYNKTLRLLFRSRFRDISTGIRVIHKSLLMEIQLNSNSPFIGAELAIKSMLRGFPVGEVGIQTFPRTFGKGSATSPKNIFRTIIDIWRIHKEIFSDTYELPRLRTRDKK